MADGVRLTTSRDVARCLAVVVLAGAAGFTAACQKPEPEAQAAAPAVMEVGQENVVVVERADIRTGPLVSGQLEAEHSATIRAQVGGSVLQATLQEGQPVKKGALLARIEERTLRDGVASAESELRAAETSLEWSRKELQRNESLVKAGALAERDVEVARNQVSAGEAQVEVVRTRLASAREQLADATVFAPISGIVAERHVNVGDVVTPGAELYTIIDPSSMRLEASVPSMELDAVKVDAPVEFQVRGYPDQTFEGRIERISPSADPATRQVPIFVAIPNTSGRLVAGLFAEGRVLEQAHSALVVPEGAVNQSGARPWVLRVRDGKVERVDVELGLRDDQTERVELVAGVAEGDQLLIGASQGMTPGTPVRIRGRQTE